MTRQGSRDTVWGPPCGQYRTRGLPGIQHPTFCNKHADGTAEGQVRRPVPMQGGRHVSGANPLSGVMARSCDGAAVQGSSAQSSVRLSLRAAAEFRFHPFSKATTSATRRPTSSTHTYLMNQHGASSIPPQVPLGRCAKREGPTGGPSLSAVASVGHPRWLSLFARPLLPSQFAGSSGHFRRPV
jgi:hypothetical protein